MKTCNELEKLFGLFFQDGILDLEFFKGKTLDDTTTPEDLRNQEFELPDLSSTPPSLGSETSWYRKNLFLSFFIKIQHTTKIL